MCQLGLGISPVILMPVWGSGQSRQHVPVAKSAETDPNLSIPPSIS